MIGVYNDLSTIVIDEGSYERQVHLMSEEMRKTPAPNPAAASVSGDRQNP
jgi:hypothetical protein